MVSLSNIKRVVTVFILRPNEDGHTEQEFANKQIQNHINNDYKIAVFRRCATMPTFPNHWAGVSGSIEDEDSSPLDAAIRELSEETNLEELFQMYMGIRRDTKVDDSAQVRFHMKAGLHVDLSSNRSGGVFGARIIRVYPFALRLPSTSSIEDSDTPSQLSSTTRNGCSLWSNIMMRGTEHDEMKFLSLNDFFDLSPCVPSLKMAFHHATSGAYLEVRFSYVIFLYCLLRWINH